jgi:hypothetical protein
MIPHIEAGDKWVHVGGNFPVQKEAFCVLDINALRAILTEAENGGGCVVITTDGMYATEKYYHEHKLVQSKPTL